LRKFLHLMSLPTISSKYPRFTSTQVHLQPQNNAGSRPPVGAVKPLPKGNHLLRSSATCHVFCALHDTVNGWKVNRWSTSPRKTSRYMSTTYSRTIFTLNKICLSCKPHGNDARECSSPRTFIFLKSERLNTSCPAPSEWSPVWGTCSQEHRFNHG